MKPASDQISDPVVHGAPFPWSGQAYAVLTVGVALLVSAPFLLVSLPPLLDAPGHLGQFAVQAAGPQSPLHRYFSFHWAFRLNLGTDLLMEALRRPLGLAHAFWVVTAAIPALTAAGILMLARAANPRGAAGIGWALMFVYAWPFSYGFLNYVLASALTLIAFAAWITLDRRPVLREAIFWAVTPVLMVVHAIGGGLLPILVVARTYGLTEPASAGEGWRGWIRRGWATARIARPMLGVVPAIALWKMSDHSGSLPTRYDLKEKLNALVMALRDQDRMLDLASVVLVVATLIVGRALGARYTRANRWAVGAVAILFLLLPSQFNGASFTDMRLVPMMAILALTLQDWSQVRRPARILVTAAGLGLFVTRLAVTATGFSAYERAYAAERQALPHIARGTRVFALVSRRCSARRFWRMSRLDHIPALATAERESWVNAHWDVGTIHLLGITYRPSPDFYHDPSHYVWPAACLRTTDPPRTPEEWRDRRRTLEDVLASMPLAKADYLWLIQTRLSRAPATVHLVPVWSSGGSALYRIVPRPSGSS